MDALVKSCNICGFGQAICGFGQVCLGMSNILQNNKATIFLGGVELFCLFVASSYTSLEATVLLSCFSWLWSSMPKTL